MTATVRRLGAPICFALPHARCAAGRAAIAIGILAPLLIGWGAHAAHGEEIYYVDGADSACSDTGPGTSALPYCSISAAVADHAGPGTTFLVRPAVYREQVTIPSPGGAPGERITFRALGPGTIVDGADDLSSPSLWVPHAGDVWRAPGVTWGTQQVLVNDMRIAASAVDPVALPANSFRYITGQGLYVNVGGGNPGTQQILVGRRIFGFRGSERPFVTIEGFEITRTEDRGIYFTSGSDSVEILNNRVSFANRAGIQVTSSSNVRFEGNRSSDNLDHGIVFSGVDGSVIKNNLSLRNRKWWGGEAAGIYLTSSAGNRIEGNRISDNTGSGIYVQTSSDNNLWVQNRAWANGAHGYDHHSSIGARHVGDVAWGNGRNGFAFRGTSTGGRLHNCIAAENGAAGPHFNLEVESTASASFASNDNLYWNLSGSPAIRFHAVTYTTLSAFASATGNDTRAFQEDPRFVDPAGGDFHLTAGSRAIDSGNSSVLDWPATDAEGRGRFDDPATTNTGMGPVPYADRGALEYVVALPPVASLVVTPASGFAPLAVVADASASYDTDGVIVSYEFDFGDGTRVGPQADPTASHTFAEGTWTVRVTVRDDSSLTASVSRTVQATGNQPANGVIDTPRGNLTIAAGQTVFFTGTASDAEGDLPLDLLWDFGGGASTQTIEDPTWVQFDTPGTYPVTFRAADRNGRADPTPDTRVITVTGPPAQLGADEIHWTVISPTAVTFDWRGSANSIRYGLTSAYSNTVTAVTPSPKPWSSSGPFWEAKLTGLQPNTVYHYAIGNHPDHTFRTPPPRGSSNFTAAAGGDIGSTLYYWRVGHVAAQIAADPPHLFLALGDLTYGDEHGQAAVGQHFNDVMLWSRETAYLPTWGNHDWDSPDNLKNYKGRFHLPNPQTSPGVPSSSCCGEDWYWFDYGNVRFIAYPEPWSDAFSDWRDKAIPLMDAAEADPAIRFIVTFGHRPAYSSGHHNGSGSLQSYMGELGATHPKYVLNLNGHSHNYERTHPQNGVIHVTSGNLGATLEAESGSCLWAGGCPPPSWSAFRAMRHGYVRLHFTAHGIRGQAICGPAGDSNSPNDVFCEPGTVMDEFVIGTPDSPPIVSAPVSVTVPEGSALGLNVAASDPDGDPIASLTANLSALPVGHGATFAPSAENASGTLSWTPTFADGRLAPYAVTFTAVNALAGSTTTDITVTQVDRRPTVQAPAATSGRERDTIRVAVSAFDPDGEPIAALTAHLEALPVGHDAVFATVPAHTTGALTWTPTYADGGRTYSVTFTAANALVDSAITAITVENLDRAPIVTAPATAAAAERETLRVNVTAGDPDGEPFSLAADLSSLPPGHGAVFATGPGNTTGQLTWVPGALPSGGPFPVPFTASNALSGTAATSIMVDRRPLLTAPALVDASENVPLSVAVSVQDPDSDPIASLTAHLSSLPAGNNASFTVAPGNTSATLTWTPTFFDGGASYAVRFTATNALAVSETTIILVSNVDRPPRATAPASVAGREGESITVTATASDPDGEPIASLRADLSRLPAGHGALFTPAPGNTSGLLTWTPASLPSPGPFDVTFTATNALAGSTVTSITVDRRPIVNVPPAISATEHSLLSVGLTASDPDGEPISSLTADLAALPAGHDARFTPASGNGSATLTWTPTYADGGTSYPLSFTAANALTGTAASRITVNNVDRLPVVGAPASASVFEGESLAVSITAGDPDGEPIASLTADLSALPAGHGAVFTVDPGNAMGLFAWIPDFDHGGSSYPVVFRAANGGVGTAATSIAVTHVERAPAVNAPASVSGSEATQITVVVSASDPDGDPIAALMADLAALPPGHGGSFTPGPGNTTGTLVWTPTYADAGGHSVIFTAANNLFHSIKTLILVENVDRGPKLDAPTAVAGAERRTLTVTVFANDPDGEPIESLAADLSALPAGHSAVFAPALGNGSGTLTWTPQALPSGGPFAITFNAANAMSDTAVTEITVDRLPLVTAPTSVSAEENARVTVAVTATDPDGDPIATLTADLAALPAGHGAVFASAAGNGSGTLTWTPTFADGARSYAVTFTAANALSASATTTIPVANVDRAPAVVSPATAPAQEGEPLTVSVTASDPDGEPIVTLTADLSALPPGHGASFAPGPDHLTGTLTWTPRSPPTAGPFSVSFTATNALSGTSVTAIQVDRRPQVTVPPTASTDENVLLTIGVGASDPDGDPIETLTADLTRLPAGHGAIFTVDSAHASGTFTWTPTFADGGSSYSVVFTATNKLSDSAPTTIAVAQVDRAPVVVVAPGASIMEQEPLHMNVSVNDPDDEPIMTLTADLSALPANHGAVFTADDGNLSGSLTWIPGFNAGRTEPYPVAFTAANALVGSAVAHVTVVNIDRAPVLTAPASVWGREHELLTVEVLAGDPDGEPIVSLAADLASLPPDHDAEFTPGAGGSSGTLAWTPRPQHADASPYTVKFVATNALADSAATAIFLDRAPVVSAPASAGGYDGDTIRVVVTVADPDADPVHSLTADLSSLPPGHQATFAADSGNHTGTLTWVPSRSDTGATYPAVFTATNSLARSATTSIKVLAANRGPRAALRVTPPTGFAALTVTASAQRSTSMEHSIVSYVFDFGDGTVVGPQGAPAAVHAYAVGEWQAKVIVTDELGNADSAFVMVKVYQNLAVNSSFEASSDGWKAYGGATMERAHGGRSGDYCLEITGPASVVEQFGVNDSPNWVLMTPGAGVRYRFTAWVRSDPANGIGRLRVREYWGGDQVGTTSWSGDVVLSPTWQILVLDHVTWTTGSTLDFQVLNIPTVPGKFFQVDDVAIQLMSLNATPVPPERPDVPGLSAAFFPNPAVRGGDLRFTIVRPGPVAIDLHDAHGRRLRVLLDAASLPAGRHEVHFDGRGETGERLRPGVYFFHLRSAEGGVSGRFVILE